MTSALELSAPVRIVGSPAISRKYSLALKSHGIDSQCISGQQAAGRGLLRIARAAGLIGSQ